MKRNVIAWTFLSLFIALPPVFADENSVEFYRKCVDMEIEHCRIKAERADSRSPHIREAAQKARDQANYYENNRDVLLQQLEREGLRAKHHKVRRYLIDSYYENRLALE